MLGKVAIIGGGKMGEVIASGIIRNRLASAEDVTIADVLNERREFLKMEYGVQVTDRSGEAAGTADMVILAIKPQKIGEVLKELSGIIDEAKLVVTIAAGVPIQAIEKGLGKKTRVVRAMPNTPAMVNEGATALAKGANASDLDLELAKALFDSVGEAVVVEEEMLDAVTGLSGSGPAYGFIMIDALSDAGVLMGLSREVSLKLAAQTMLGAAKLCLATGKHPGELRDMVTSPGGTTIAGIRALEKGKIRAALMNAVEAATLRSKELGKK